MTTPNKASLLLLSTGKGSKRAHAIARVLAAREARHQAQQAGIRQCADILHRHWRNASPGAEAWVLSEAEDEILSLLDVRPDYAPIPVEVSPC